MNGKFFVLSGPSGIGKDTVLRQVCQSIPLIESVSATTRSPRPGEIEGTHYYFLSPEIFQERIRADAFLEYAAYGDNYYGTPAEPVQQTLERGVNMVAILDVQGAQQVKARMPDSVLIFLRPPSWGELEARLRGRGTESEDKIQRRLQIAHEEMAQIARYDYVVTNQTLATAVDVVQAIVRAETKHLGVLQYGSV